MSQDYSSPEEFEKSLEGYHKEAPKYLKQQREALKKNLGSSTENINKERVRQGYKPKKFDRATQGLYDFLDK